MQIDLNDVTKHFLNLFWGLIAEDEPLRPEGALILKQRLQGPNDRPMTHYLPIGVPAVTKSPEPSWMGSSRSESMHITGRYRRRDFGHIDLEVTFEDSKYYTKPFKLAAVFTLIPDGFRICLPRE
jgi:hypothetical protein